MQLTGPFNVTAAGQTLSLTLPQSAAQTQPFVAAIVANTSPFALSLTASGGAWTKWLMPFYEDFVPLVWGFAGSISATTVAVSSPGSSTGQVFVTWLTSADTLPQADQFPVSLAAQAITGTITAAISGIVPISQADRTIFSQSTPASPFTITGFQTTDQYVIFSLQPTGGHNDPMVINSVVGQQSGIVYATFLPVTQNYYSVCPILPSLDTGLVITYISPGVNGLGTFSATASPVAPPPPALAITNTNADVVANANSTTVILGAGANQNVFRLLTIDLEIASFNGAGTSITASMNGLTTGGASVEFLRLDTGGAVISTTISRDLRAIDVATWSLAGTPRALQLQVAVGGAANGVAAGRVSYQQLN